MNYGLLIYLFPLSGVAGILVNVIICGCIQKLYELRGKGTPNVDHLSTVLIFHCWIIVWFIFYYIFNIINIIKL